MEILGFLTGIIGSYVVCIIFNEKPFRIFTTILALYMVSMWFNYDGSYLFTMEQTDASASLLFLESTVGLFVYSFPVMRGLYGYGNWMDKKSDNTRQSLKLLGKLIHLFFH